MTAQERKAAQRVARLSRRLLEIQRQERLTTTQLKVALAALEQTCAQAAQTGA
jgi:hypothetical protein